MKRTDLGQRKALIYGMLIAGVSGFSLCMEKNPATCRHLRAAPGVLYRHIALWVSTMEIFHYTNTCHYARGALVPAWVRRGVSKLGGKALGKIPQSS